MKKPHIILGSGYGDEGKGVFTDYLASKLSKPLVVRFNGGHQAGHTVTMPDGRSHIFSNFGAGTFRNIPTYFSNFCTVDPSGIVNEYAALTELGLDPILFIDQMAMVVTPFDKYYNLNSAAMIHGTVGVGFGACVERNLGPCKLFFQDIFIPRLLQKKLIAIRDYYLDKYDGNDTDNYLAILRTDYDYFIAECAEVADIAQTVIEGRIMSSQKYMTLIFEGAQGILLDMDFGVFPNMTRSNTTSKNAITLLARNGITEKPEVYYMTRSYQTRHGNGWMSTDHEAIPPVELFGNENESNKDDGWQGKFRTGLFDEDMFDYATRADYNFSAHATHHTVVSCMDQVKDFRYMTGGIIKNLAGDSEQFMDSIKRGKNLYFNESPCSETIVKFN